MKLLWLPMGILLLSLTGCSMGSTSSGTSVPANQTTANTEMANAQELQSIVQEFAQNIPLTIALKEEPTGRMTVYQIDSGLERISYLLSKGQRTSEEDDLPHSPYTIIISNRNGASFLIPSQGNIFKYSTNFEQAVYTFDLKDESLFDSLRFLFDGYEARPQNVSIADMDGENIAERWINAYRQYLLSTIPGGSNELIDAKIISMDVMNTSDDVLQVSFDIALRPANDVGQCWRASGGYSGKDELSDYIIAPRIIELKKQCDRWYCIRVLGS